MQFEGGRSAEEIRKFWQNWEHPSINKQEWTGQEVDQLKAIAAKHGHLHWQKIAEELGVRVGPPTPQGTGPRVVWVLQLGGRRLWGPHRMRVTPQPRPVARSLLDLVWPLSRVWPSGRVTPPRFSDPRALPPESTHACVLKASRSPAGCPPSLSLSFSPRPSSSEELVWGCWRALFLVAVGFFCCCSPFLR